MQTYVGDLLIHDLSHPAKIQKKIVSILRDQGISPEKYPAKDRIADQEQDSNEGNEEEIDEDIAEVEEEA